MKDVGETAKTGLPVRLMFPEDFRVLRIVPIIALLVPAVPSLLSRVNFSCPAVGMDDALLEVALFNEPFRGCVTR
jgi:hypothetical protein